MLVSREFENFCGRVAGFILEFSKLFKYEWLTANTFMAFMFSTA